MKNEKVKVFQSKTGRYANIPRKVAYMKDGTVNLQWLNRFGMQLVMPENAITLPVDESPFSVPTREYSPDEISDIMSGKKIPLAEDTPVEKRAYKKRK